MDKQLVAERLSAKYGVRVSVGLHRWIEDVRDKGGKIVSQIVHDEGEKFTRADDGPVSQADIDEATAAALQEYPSGQKPTPDDEISLLKKRVADLERDIVRVRL